MSGLPLLVEYRGERIEVTESCIGIEFHGRAASHTSYLSVCAPDGIPEIDTIIQRVQAHIDNFLQAPYLLGKFDCDLWYSISKNWDTGAAQIRMPCSQTGEVLAELERQGFVMVDPVNLSLDAPLYLDKHSLGNLVAPLLEPGSRAKAESELANALAVSAAHQGEAHKQMALFR